MHFQRTVPGWTKGLIPGMRQVVKAVDAGNILRDAKMIQPDCVTVLRHWYDDDQVFGGTWGDNLARARVFFASFIDETFRREYAPHVDFVEEWNEYLANSQNAQEIAERVRWAEAAAYVWDTDYQSQSDYSHIRLVLCNTAVGNLINWEFVDTAVNWDCVLGYHPYTYWQNGKRPDWEWDNLSGLWNTMEEEEFFHGFDNMPNWIFTEAGPFESATHGWKSPKCLDNDRDKYVEAMRLWYRDVKQTPAFQEGRIIGADYPAAVFNSGSWPGAWTTFETKEKELVALAEMFRDERGTVVPPVEPPPPTEPLPDYVRVVEGIGHLNLRSVPRIINPTTDIGDLDPGGGPLKVVGRDGDWLQVAGWAHGDYLEEVE